MSTVVMGSSSSSPKVGHVGIEYAAARRMSDVCLVNLHAAIVSQTRGIQRRQIRMVRGCEKFLPAVA